MAELISQERFEIWDQFIERWPIEKLWAITVEEYNTLGSKDSFCYCGKKAEDLGSIWDSSAFKCICPVSPMVRGISRWSFGKN